MQKIRIIFEKTGTAKFISHLDLVRVVTRAIRRAGIPIVYSQGFNPVPRLSFALPLSLGQESLREMMNFKVEPDMTPSEALERLAPQLPDGLVLKEAYVPEDVKVKELQYAEYTITVEDELDVDAARACFARDEITLIKKTKSGEKLTDIRPLIKQIGISDGQISCVLNSRDPFFLNPEYVMKALSEYTGKQFERYYILRNEVYTEDMELYR